MPDDSNITVIEKFYDEASGLVDALVMPKSEWDVLTIEQRDVLKAERIAEHVARLAAPTELEPE